MWRIALVLVVLLAACSEKGGGGGSTRELLQRVEVAARVSGIVLDSDTLILSDVISVDGDDPPSLTNYRCIGQSCTRLNQNDDPLIDPLVQTVVELVNFTEPEANYSEISEHRGVGLSENSFNRTVSGDRWSFTNYGAWLNHAAFNTIISTATVRGIPLQTAYNISFGNDTGTNPVAEGVVWTGVMLGNTRHTSQQPTIRALRGDATVSFALATDTLDVKFNNVIYLDTAESFPDMNWFDIDVADGAFERRNIAGHIAGEFYGPDHSEVGGVFTHPSAMGAFGAKK